MLEHDSPDYPPSGGVMSATTRRVWRALVVLHGAGMDAVGPTDVVNLIKSECGKKLQTTVVTEHLRKLAALGRVERLPQGERRALYRAIEII